MNNARESKMQGKRTKKNKKDKKGNNDTSDDIKEMELPDDFSIFGGGSTITSFGEDDSYLDEFDDERGGGDADAAEQRAATRFSKLQDALSLAATLPSEKRSIKREGIYRVLFKAITNYATSPEMLESHWTNLLEACLFSIQGKGNAKPSEQYAACRVLEASAVVLGEDQDEIVEQLNDQLKRIVNATGKAAQVRCAALRCLAMVHFICGTDCLEEGEDCASIMDLCEKVAAEKYRGEEVSPLLRATGLDCWSLLSTTFHDATVAAGDGYDDDLGRGLQLLPLLASCLDSEGSDYAGLRRSAGECVSLIHEARLNLGLDEEEAENATERKFRRGSWDGSEWEVLMDEVKQRIAELSVESSHYMSKQAKKQQKSTFRDFNNTIVDDEAPEEVVNWKGGQLNLNSWKEIVQLNFVRHCLQGGFQIQLMTNETLHGVFGATFNASGTSLSQLEKRLFMSKTSEAAKSADKARTKQRRTRTNVKNHFLTADGDDI